MTTKVGNKGQETRGLVVNCNIGAPTDVQTDDQTLWNLLSTMMLSRTWEVGMDITHKGEPEERGEFMGGSWEVKTPGDNGWEGKSLNTQGHPKEE